MKEQLLLSSAWEEVRDSDGTTYKPLFKFYTAAKEEIHFRHFASSNPPAWSVGEQAITSVLVFPKE